MAKRHGLIEASEISLGGFAPIVLSVAKRHGLIEAGIDGVVVQRIDRVIRGKTPRPH